MKRLEIKATDRLDELLQSLKDRTERSKTELVHDAVALLAWVEQVYSNGHAIGEIDPESGTVVSRFAMPIFQQFTGGADREGDRSAAHLR